MARSSVVVGGGFVGLSCALQLQRAGRRVTLVDAGGIGSAQAASYGNAGTMAVYANVPTNSPSVLRNLPSMVGDADGPLSMSASPHLATMGPWAALFAWHCRPASVERTAAALGRLLSRAESGYEAVFDQAGVDPDGAMGAFASGDAGAGLPFARRGGYLLLQRSEAAMRASAAGAAPRRRHVRGLRMDALSPDEVVDLEPGLLPRACEGGAWFFRDGWFLNEPAAMLRALAAGFEARGGDVRVGAKAVAVDAAGAEASVRLDDGATVVADGVVVAAGAYSKPLVQGLGEYCPLDTERGYHVAFEPGSERRLTRAVCDPAAGFIASPMAGGLRVAGKVELGGLAAPLDASRCDAIERGTRRLLGDGVGPRDAAQDWLGFRPTMPDALPVIGASAKAANVLYAFGHQHVGWTLGGITGQLVAELADGRAPSIDLAPYRLGRFRPPFFF